ncbi:MarR family winged helix-turn-helix transcriptional regulator [Kitasatospora sp. NPDC094015]|uniref:MarR family winged helix-turn-helix transcriptional regulator n=1 Tax=Kitasatospora sp. NPDC094015 TaxID=3155205 RepID=UPI003321C967
MTTALPTALPTAPPAAPQLNGQIIGRAHYATRVLLERRLARSGLTFHQSLALNATADQGGSATREHLVARLTGGLKVDPPVVLAALAGLTADGLLAEPPGEPDRLALTSRGRARQEEIRAEVAGLTARLYGDLPAEDLAAAARVLAAVTARAEAVAEAEAAG